MVHMNLIITHLSDSLSGRFRNLERGVQPLVREAHSKICGLSRPLPSRKSPNCISRSNSRPSGDQLGTDTRVELCWVVAACQCCIII